ncbi:hypothetical protein Tco_1385454 [Tanacetum coccineum]
MDLSDPIDTPMVDRLKLDEDLMGIPVIRDVKIQEEVRREVLSFLEIGWLAGHQRNNEAWQYQLQRLNTSPCLDVVLKSFGCDPSSKTTDLTSIKFLCTVITKVLLLCAVTTSNTLALNTLTTNTMAEQNIPAQPPTRTDEQIVPRSQWLTIGKSNLLFNAQKIQKNPIFQISVDILKNTNFFQALTASANVPAYDDYILEISSLSLKPSSYLRPKKPSKLSYPQKVIKGKASSQLVDEEDEGSTRTYSSKEKVMILIWLAKKLSLETPQEKREGEGDDADLERAIKLSLDPAFLPHSRAPVGGVMIRDPVSETTSKLHEVVGKGKAVVTEEQVAHSLIDLSKKKRTTDQFILARRDQTPPDSTTGPSSQHDDDSSEKVIHESSSTSDSERTESDTEAAAPKGDKDQDEVDTSTVTSGVSIPVSAPEKAHEALAGPDPEPMKEDQTGSDSGKLHVSLAGPNPEHMDDDFLATAYPKVHENLKLITDERVIDNKPESHSGSMSSMKNLDDTFNFGDQFLHDKPTEDDQEKSKDREESDSTIPDSSHQTVTSTPPVIAPFTEVSSSKPSSLLRVARLEQEMSEVKKTDHSADVLASIKSQVPTVVDKYLGTKLDDALLKILERHTADLIEKYSVLPGPESIKNQESEKSPKEIIRIKREQGEEKQDSTYSIRSTDKVALEEFDLKSALFKHMNKNKTANRNPANYHLYHALMEALIADEDAMDKEVAVKVKDHKRKHDSDDDEDDDDDEGPSAGSNQGRSAKRRRPESAASGSAQPPSKDDHQSSKKPRESDASASKQHPALTSTGWQITDTRDDVVNSLMHMLPNNIQITDTNSFIVSKKRSSDSSKKLKGIQTLTPAEQEAADIMKALKESKKMSKRQPGTGGSNEGTGNILGVPDESTVISRASSEGTRSKPGVPDEEKLIL